MAFGTINPTGPTLFTWTHDQENPLITPPVTAADNGDSSDDDIVNGNDDGGDHSNPIASSDDDYSDDGWSSDDGSDVDHPRSSSAPPRIPTPPPQQTAEQRRAAMYANRLPSAWTAGNSSKVLDRPLVKDLTEKYENGKDCMVHGRDKEVDQIIRMMGQPKGGIRPILAGPEGIGKKSIAKKLAAKLLSEDCPEFLKGHRVFMIDGLALMAQTPSAMGTDRAGPVLKMIIERTIRATDGKCVFFFRDLDKVISYGPVKTYLSSYFRKGLPCFASVSSGKDDEKVKKVQKAFKDYNFVTCPVDEVSKPVAKEILLDKLAKNPHPDGVTLTAAAVDMVVNLADTYIHNRPSPVKTYHLAFEVQNRVAQIRAKALATQDANGNGRRVRPAKVTAQDVAAIVSEKTGISASSLATSDWEFLDNLEERFRTEIIGQDHAIKTVSARIQSCKLGLRDPKKPWAAFMFMGPTGVGKTELAKLIAKELFNDENGLLRLDMSEYAEPHTISHLLGSPPGYVGHNSGGVLTEALKKKKHWVILLDEIEKAHPEVVKTFLQVFNDGRLTDRQGETVDCTGCVFLMTSNIAAEKLFDNPELTPEVKAELRQRLSPEFCNRLTGIIPFKPLDPSDCPKVIDVHLRRLKARWEDTFDLQWSDEVINYCMDELDIDPEFGHRGLCRLVEQAVNAALTNASRSTRQPPAGRVTLFIEDGDLVARIETDTAVEAVASSSQ